MSAEIKTLATKEIYRNRWMALKVDRVQRADGSEGIYSVVEKGSLSRCTMMRFLSSNSFAIRWG